MEKRWHGKECLWGDRGRVDIPVQVSADALSADGSMKNLSLCGALVKAAVDLGLHALIQVSINTRPESQRVAAITAYISRKTTEAVGVEWCEFAPSVVKDLCFGRLRYRSPESVAVRAIGSPQLLRPRMEPCFIALM